MKIIAWKRTLAVVAASLLAMAPLSGALAQSAQNVVRPGLGEDPGPPVVTPFTLPEGVRIVGDIRGAHDISGECEDTSAEPRGSGAFVRICVPLENLTGSSAYVEFPPGLVVVATMEGRAQNGLLIERTVLTVPPIQRGGGGCRRPDDARSSQARVEEDRCPHVVPMYLYCVNEKRDPSAPHFTYAIAGVTRDAALQELLRLLEGKTIDTPEKTGVVQNALFSITDGRGLTREDRAALAAL